MNSDQVKVMVEEAWGQIKHPTLQSLIEMVLLFSKDNPGEE